MRPLDLHSIQYFKNKNVILKNIESFYGLDAYAYLQKVYGDLVFTENVNQNFIGVYQIEDKILFSEDIFCKEIKNLNQLGNLIPQCIALKVSDVFSNSSKEGYTLKHKGYAKSASRRCTSGKKVLNNLRRQISSLNFVKFSETNSYQSPESYIDYLRNNPDNITIESLLEINYLIFEKIKLNFNNNLINNHCIAETRVQKMINGDSLVRHFGASHDEPYLFTALNYLVTGDFEGRHLYGGERSLVDLSRYVHDFNYALDFNPYNDPITEYADTYLFKPSQQETLYVSAANPLFYHAVKEHLGGAEVYAIITDIRLRP
jgi:hypothetical protein